VDCIVLSSDGRKTLILRTPWWSTFNSPWA
jgi:hypothetical protein